MEVDEIEKWADEFTRFQQRFAGLFGRSEGREQAAKYVRGLLSPVERKNGWQVAEAVGDPTPDATQRLLYSTQWDADGARNELQRFVIEVLGDAEGIGVVDETGFLKKGTKSAGVQRQYSGTAGKCENCQVGVFLSYATAQGHTFLDRRLYLPESWCADRERCQAAKIPPAVGFASKATLARQMLEQAWARGVPMRWVTGDEVYGAAADLRQSIAQHGRWYVFAVRTHLTLWPTRPRVGVPAWQGQGRPPTRAKVLADTQPPLPVVAVAAAWPASRWQRLTVAAGAKGPRTYDWARQRIVENEDGLPGRDGWLLVRRSMTDPEELAYYLSNAPAETPLLKLAQVAATRYTIEQCFEEAKGHTGLDQYEVRYWHSWYRHITLSLMAHAWLASLRLLAQQKKGGRPLARTPNRARNTSLTCCRSALAEPFVCLLPGLVSVATGETLTSATRSLAPLLASATWPPFFTPTLTAVVVVSKGCARPNSPNSIKSPV